ncbi:MAG: hypothetical protein HY401_06260 [Elusimicrobia bacterium]|nr:hypothetical protein [Elusimicrobiota bacterium]
MLGLDRLGRFMERLGNPQEKLRVVHAAGTNGKGSVCKMLYNVLRAAGYKAGHYSSPHLYDVTERIEAAGAAISVADFSRIGESLMRVAGHEALTYFEFLTALAFVYFKEVKADPVVLETGLGGRLDATNIVNRPLVSVITSIGLDHTQWLGSTLSKIAAEKGGIVKKGVPVVVGEMPKEAGEVIAGIAQKNDTRLIVVSSQAWTCKPLWEENAQIVHGEGNYRLGILGAEQAGNVACVIEVAKILNRNGIAIPAEVLKQGLSGTTLIGRWELIKENGRAWVLDVAHNRDAVAGFMKTLLASPWARRPKRLICGFLKDKDYVAIIELLAPYFEEFYLPQIASDRALPASTLAIALKNLTSRDIRIFPGVGEAVAAAQKNNRVDLTAVVGSFRLAGPARTYLLAKKRL